MLDLAMGGGYARRRVANIVGDKSTGKTLLMIEGCANFAAQEPKAKIRYREAEHAFDPMYAATLGMPTDRVDFGTSLVTVEDLFEDLLAVVQGAKAKQPELYIVDSLDALSDREELKRDIDQGTYGTAKAKYMSQMFRRLIGELDKKDVTVLVVSQVRDKIGAMLGPKTTRSGGRALDFYASQVVYLNHMGRLARTIKGVKRATGVKLRAKIDKNKVGLPFREARFQISFGFGIDDAESCLSWLEEVKALDYVNCKKGDVGKYLDDLDDMDREEHGKEMAFIHDACQRKWYEIEKSFMPRRTKYGS
jgi:recombination protein RecA